MINKLVINYFSYDPESGNVYWKINSPNNVRKKGQIAGTLHHTGHIAIMVKGRHLLAHRIGWFLHYGEWPQLIDHINGKGSDNRIINLRSVDQRTNCWNRIEHRNTDKFPGVTFDKSRNRWRTRYQVKGKIKTAGQYKTKEEAILAMKKVFNTMQLINGNYQNKEKIEK